MRTGVVTRAERGVCCQLFQVLPNFHLCFCISVKTQRTSCLFLLENSTLHKKLVYTLNIKMWIFFAQAIVKSTACATYCTDDLLWEMQSACPFSDYELKILFVWWLTKSQPKSTIMHRNHERQSNLIYLVVGRNFNLSLFKGTKKWPWQQILLHYSLSTWQIDSMLPCVCLVTDHRWCQNEQKRGTLGNSWVFHWYSYTFWHMWSITEHIQGNMESVCQVGRE